MMLMFFFIEKFIIQEYHRAKVEIDQNLIQIPRSNVCRRSIVWLIVGGEGRGRSE